MTRKNSCDEPLRKARKTQQAKPTRQLHGQLSGAGVTAKRAYSRAQFCRNVSCLADNVFFQKQTRFQAASNLIPVACSYIEKEQSALSGPIG